MHLLSPVYSDVAWRHEDGQAWVAVIHADFGCSDAHLQVLCQNVLNMFVTSRGKIY